MKFSNWALYVLQAKTKYPAGHRMNDAIPSIVSHSANASENIGKLEKVPQAVVISMDPIRKKLSHSFLHQSTGLSFLGDDVNVVGVNGLETNTAIPVEFDAEQFFSSTAEIKTPSLFSFLQRFQGGLELMDNIEVSNSERETVRVGRVCVLPPLLAELAISNNQASPKELLLLFIKKIVLLQINEWKIFNIKMPEEKIFEDLTVKDIYNLDGKTPPEDNQLRITGHLDRHVHLDDDSSDDEGEKEKEGKIVAGVLDIEYARVYLPILRTLWAYTQKEEDVGVMTVNRTPITEESDMDWYLEKKEQILKSTKKENVKESSNYECNPLSEEIRHLAQAITSDRNQRFASDEDDISSPST